MDEIKRNCVNLINSHAKLVVNAGSWKHLAKNHPDLVMHIFRNNK